MSNLKEHMAEQDEITAMCEASTCDHPECEGSKCRTCGDRYDPNGDGWDGKCPDCADIRQERKDLRDGVGATRLSGPEIATILAALRYMQNDMEADGEDWEWGATATDNFTREPLGTDEIDALCERLSAGQKPQRTNFDRATEGLQLCAKMEELTGVDTIASQLTDVICHLMHTCRLMRDEDGEIMDFEAALETARANFEAECEEDPDQ